MPHRAFRLAALGFAALLLTTHPAPAPVTILPATPAPKAKPKTAPASSSAGSLGSRVAPFAGGYNGWDNGKTKTEGRVSISTRGNSATIEGNFHSSERYESVTYDGKIPRQTVVLQPVSGPDARDGVVGQARMRVEIEQRAGGSSKRKAGKTDEALVQFSESIIDVSFVAFRFLIDGQRCIVSFRHEPTL